MFLVYWSLGNPNCKRVYCFPAMRWSIVICEAVKEVMFVIHFFGKHENFGYVSSVGAIFTESNITSTCNTKHVDIRYKYVNEYIEDRVVKIIFVDSADNDRNILTKNLVLSFTRNIQRRW